MASLSELNKREREIRKALDDLKRGLEKKIISKSDYEAAKADNERQLKAIEEERKHLIGLPGLPPAPPIPLPPAPEPPKRKKQKQKTPKPPDSEMIKRAVLSKSVPIKKTEKEPKTPLPSLRAEEPKTEPKKKKTDKPPAQEKKKTPTIKKPKKKPLPKPKKIIKAVKKAEKSKTHHHSHIISPSGTGDIEHFLKQQGKEIRFAEHEMEKLFDIALQNKEKIAELKSLKKEVEEIRKKIEGPDAKKIEEIVYSEFEKMNAIIEENSAKEKSFMEQIKVELDSLRNEINNLKKKEGDIEKLDIAGLRRDVESLKEKTGWIEENIENFDMKPLYEMIKDLENKLNVLKVSSPLIID